MNISKDLPRFLLFAIIAVLILTLLKQWVDFSSNYDADMVERRNQQYENELLADPINIVSVSQKDTNLNTKAIDNTAESSPILNEKRNTLVQPSNSSRNIVVETDLIRVTIDSLGGDIIEVALLKHLSKKKKMQNHYYY